MIPKVLARSAERLVEDLTVTVARKVKEKIVVLIVIKKPWRT
jgi:hypothetical protein